MARARLVALCGLGLVGLVACGPDVAPTPSSTQAPAAPPAAAPLTTTPDAALTGPAATCRTDGLEARFAPLPDDRGAHRVAVVWTNTGERPCTMFGFGGIDLQGPDDPTYGPTFSLRRSSEEPRTVTIAPHDSAQTVVHYLASNAPRLTWTPTSALVTPPDETRSLPLRWTFGPVLRQDGATHPGTFLSPVGAPGTPGVGTGRTPCTAAQVDVAVVDQDAGASNRYARLQFTAKPGRSCTLSGPVDVRPRGAAGLPMTREGGAGAGSVSLDSGHRASSTLHWTVAADRQVTPQALTVALSGGTADVGWSFGPVDAGGGHGIAVGPLTTAAAPR